MHILKVSSIPTLLEFGNRSLQHFTRRDVMDEDVEPVSSLWQLPEVVKICLHQKNDGSWRYPGQASRIDSPTNYSLLETFRQLGILVGIYGMDRDHPAIQAAAEYVFSCQTEKGDIRGILGNQSMPYYHGMLPEILTKIGYANDKRLIKGLEWLLTVRQDDGGWIIPAQTVPPGKRQRLSGAHYPSRPNDPCPPHTSQRAWFYAPPLLPTQVIEVILLRFKPRRCINSASSCRTITTIVKRQNIGSNSNIPSGGRTC